MWFRNGRRGLQSGRSHPPLTRRLPYRWPGRPAHSYKPPSHEMERGNTRTHSSSAPARIESERSGAATWALAVAMPHVERSSFRYFHVIAIAAAFSGAAHATCCIAAAITRIVPPHRRIGALPTGGCYQALHLTSLSIVCVCSNIPARPPPQNRRQFHGIPGYTFCVPAALTVHPNLHCSFRPWNEGAQRLQSTCGVWKEGRHH